MLKRTSLIVSVLLTLVLSLVLATGMVLADEPTPEGEVSSAPNRLQQMQEWMGAEAWAEMIQHMTERHGPEFTGQMLQWMAAGEGCPMHGEGAGFGPMFRGPDSEDGEGYGPQSQSRPGYGPMHDRSSQGRGHGWGMMGRLFGR